jgi:ParB family chromosome partitioning protein
MIEIPIDDIELNPFQPRKEVDSAEIAQLADSLNNHGLLQPIVVRRHHGRYQLIAGERRLRAAKLAGWDKVPARVVEADDRQLAELAIVENLQRKDLNALEKAHCFRRYLEEYGVTQEELASRLSLDRSTISNFIRLLDLPEPVQQALREGRITQGHARALLSLDSEEDQIALCQQIHQEGLSVRRVEQIVQERQQQKGPNLTLVRSPSGNSESRSAEHLAGLEQEFRAALGLRVSLTHNGRGKGKLVIYFQSHEEFALLRERICGEENQRMAG